MYIFSLLIGGVHASILNQGVYKYTGSGFEAPLDYEFHVELYHHLQFTPTVNLSLDIQYYPNPGGAGAPAALVVGTWLHFVL